MQTYDVSLRLGGDLNNVVPKVGVTAPEVLVLRALHGADAVVDMKPRDMDKRPHSEERSRLISNYGPKIVLKLFGAPHSGQKLPLKVDDFQGEMPEPQEDENLNTFGIRA